MCNSWTRCTNRRREELQPQLVVIEIGWPRRSGACTAKLLRARRWARRPLSCRTLDVPEEDSQISGDFDFHFFDGLASDLLTQIYPSLVKRRAVEFEARSQLMPRPKIAQARPSWSPKRKAFSDRNHVCDFDRLNASTSIKLLSATDQQLRTGTHGQDQLVDPMVSMFIVQAITPLGKPVLLLFVHFFHRCPYLSTLSVNKSPINRSVTVPRISGCLRIKLPKLKPS